MRDIKQSGYPAAVFLQFTTGALKFRSRLASMGSKAGAAVGIDIGNAAVKAVALDVTRTPVRLLNYTVVDCTPGADRTAQVAVAVRTALRRLRRRPISLATAVPAAEAIARRTSAPANLSGGALAAHVALSLEEHLHQPPDELYYDFRALNPSPEDRSRRDLLLVACRREVVKAKLAALRRARVHCDVMDVEDRAMAQSLALTQKPPMPDNRAAVEAVIDMGHHRIGLHVFDQGEPVHGQNQPVEPASQPADVAERALERYQGSPDARDPDYIWLIGGGLNDKARNDLMSSLGASPLDLESMPGLELAPHLPPACSGHCRRLAVAIGLALHAGDPDAHWR